MVIIMTLWIGNGVALKVPVSCNLKKKKIK